MRTETCSRKFEVASCFEKTASATVKNFFFSKLKL